MKWVSHEVTRERSPQWLAIPPDLRGHEAALLAFCAQQENGGTINHRGWKDLDWQRACGFRRKTLRRLIGIGIAVPVAPTLLSVSAYDIYFEGRAKKASEIGLKLARLRWDRHAARITARIAQDNAAGNAARNAIEERGAAPHGGSTLSTSGSPPPKGPPLRGKPPSPAAVDRIIDAWPWPERLSAGRIERALEHVRAAGPVEVDAICAGMRTHGRDRKWARANPTITAPMYIRNRRWIEAEATAARTAAAQAAAAARTAAADPAIATPAIAAPAALTRDQLAELAATRRVVIRGAAAATTANRVARQKP